MIHLTILNNYHQTRDFSEWLGKNKECSKIDAGEYF